MADAIERAVIAQHSLPVTDERSLLAAGPRVGFGRRIVRAAASLLSWLAAKLRITHPRSVEELRVAEKERQKGIRRELRGLPTTHEPSGPDGPPEG